MKQALIIIITVITVFAIITGCNPQAKKFPEYLKEVRLAQQFSIISEDEEKYIGKIQFENHTDYDYRRPQFMHNSRFGI